MTEFTDQEVEYFATYKAALHAMQTGVGHLMNFDKNEVNLKHLRVGINSSHVSNSALADLLIEKGIIEREDFYRKLAEFAEKERDEYKRRIQERYPNTNIDLH